MRSSVKPTNDNLIDRTIETWQPRAGCDLSRDDARQINKNITGFFSVLAEWTRAEIPEQANDDGASITEEEQQR